MICAYCRRFAALPICSFCASLLCEAERFLTRTRDRVEAVVHEAERIVHDHYQQLAPFYLLYP